MQDALDLVVRTSRSVIQSPAAFGALYAASLAGVMVTAWLGLREDEE